MPSARTKGQVLNEIVQARAAEKKSTLRRDGEPAALPSGGFGGECFQESARKAGCTPGEWLLRQFSLES